MRAIPQRFCDEVASQQQQQQQQPFNGICSGTTRVGRYQKKHSAFCLSIGLCCVQAGFPHLLSSGFYGAGEDNGGRGTDSPGGRHPNRTNGAHTPTTPKVSYRPDALPAAQLTASNRYIIIIIIIIFVYLRLSNATDKCP